MTSALLLPTSYLPWQLAAAEARPLWDSVLQAVSDRQHRSGQESRRYPAPKPPFLKRLSTQVSAFVDEAVKGNGNASRYRTIREELELHNINNSAIRGEYDYDVSDNGVSDCDEEYSTDGRDSTLFARVLTSASDQIRTKLEQQFNTNGTLSGFDWMGAVSTVSTSSSLSPGSTRRRRTTPSTATPSKQLESEEDKSDLGGTPPQAADDGTSNTTEMSVLDRIARGCVLNLGKIVAVQSVATWVQNRVDDDWLQQAGHSQSHPCPFFFAACFSTASFTFV